MGRHLCYDIEGNGLLPELTKIHCIWAEDVDTGERFDFKPWELDEGIACLEDGESVIGHNIIGYDNLALKKIYPKTNLPKSKDTLLLAKMIWPADTMIDRDMALFRSGKLPGQFIKRQSLAAWGHRLGVLKTEYSGGWEEWSEEMHSYCGDDVTANVALWKLIESHLNGTHKAAKGFEWSERAIDLEHRVHPILLKQQERGFNFDRTAAVKLTADLKNQQAKLEDVLATKFGSWWQPLDPTDKGTLPKKNHSRAQTQFPDVTIKRVSEKTGKELKAYVGPPKAHYATDAPFVRVSHITFNPKSRQHLAHQLQMLYGWKPTAFGGKDGTQAVVDEATIKEIPEDVLPPDLRKIILDHFVISKTLGQVAEGNKSWLSTYNEETGKIHHRCDGLATITSRAAHSNPNLGQVISVSVDEKKVDGKVVSTSPILGLKGGFGWEARSLFIPRDGFKFITGTDASGLELGCLGHYLHPHDDGEFAERVSTPGIDIHAENARITGLSRAETKTTTYAFLYGAGPFKIGQGIGVEDDEIDDLAGCGEANRYVGWLKRKLRGAFIMPSPRDLALTVKGMRVSKKFSEGITGLKELKKGVTKAAERGFIKGIDGRKIYVRKPHAALNTLLQSAGAIICKEWMCETDLVLHTNFNEDVDYGQVAWVHDELQIEHREKSMGNEIGEISEAAIIQAGENLAYRGKLSSDFKTGRCWAETH